MSAVRVIVRVGTTWLLSLALAIVVLVGIHRVLSTWPGTFSTHTGSLREATQPLVASRDCTDLGRRRLDDAALQDFDVMKGPRGGALRSSSTLRRNSWIAAAATVGRSTNRKPMPNARP